MKLTPSILAGMYELLVQADPFRRYKLPPVEIIKFRVVRAEMCLGRYIYSPPQFQISRHEEHPSYTNVLQTMAHEITHMCCEEAHSTDHCAHGAEFNALAAKVCDAWGWNFREF